MTRRIIRKIFIAIAAAAVLLGTIALFHSTKARTVITPSVFSPGASDFSDNDFSVFVGDMPDINNNRDLSAPNALVISYDVSSGPYQPALRPDLDTQEPTSAVKITPFISGTWQTYGHSSIRFIPDTPWPADQKFRVKINHNIFNQDIKVKSYTTTFTTAPITATLASFNVYAANQQNVRAVAIVSFNYAIDTDTFAKQVSLKTDSGRIKFDVKFDKFNRTAFIISAPIALGDNARCLRLKIGHVLSADNNDRTEKIDARLTLDAADNFFKISDLDAITVDDSLGNAHQAIIINTTAPVANNTKFTKYISAYLLPKKTSTDNDEPHHWATDEITPDVLKKSQKLDLKQMNLATPGGVYQYTFSFNAPDAVNRYIYVSVDDGMMSSGGFKMIEAPSRVMPVPYPAPEVKIAGTGAILSLAGDKRLGIMARGGVNTAFVNLYKIKSSEINHLITQTFDVFAKDMEFKSWNFGAYDMSVVFKKKIPFADAAPAKTNYASVDLGDYLNRTHDDKTGIFIIQTAATERAAENADKRLILLTNLGIIRKANLDGTSTLFVSNLDTGLPAAVDVQVLGRNGNAIWAGQTNTNGRADVPKFDWSEYRNEREPVAFVARRGDDVAFIPYNAYAQRVEYSKFDVDGTYASATIPMNAFVFSDRGIYRPGETAIFGTIVKNKSFQSLGGVPVRFELRNSRGRVVSEHTISLTDDGMFNQKYEIPADATLGEYSARILSLNARNQPDNILGATTIRVEEFVPDTMKITASVNNAATDGWALANDISATIQLTNLFGTPAAHRQITASATLRPTAFSFNKYPEYVFAPATTVGQTQTKTAEFSTETDTNGTAQLAIYFGKDVPQGNYTMNLTIRGADKTGGHSVQTAISARISSAPFMVGYHADGDLSYINRNATRQIKLIAIDHTGQPIKSDDLKIQLTQRENLTSLIKDYNGYYKYQTVTRDKVILTKDINIATTGHTFKLNTANAGTYIVNILDTDDNVLNTFEYFVAPDKNTSLAADRTADMKITLDAEKYAPGDKIQVSVSAPYAGTGLITIERDKVYAYKWFRTDNTSSTQTITVPDDFEGTGYVNVSFVRDINSPDVFTTPYAYAVAPFTSDIARRTINIDLTAPEVITDGSLPIKYKTNKNARIMIFAVNTGILQVAKYKVPQPLAHFFEKSALQVETYQILSLLLPEYRALREYAKTGGGDYDDMDAGTEGVLTNPFARTTRAPVAFYSEIIDTTANTTGTIKFNIPEYFSGAIRIFAVAANTGAVGAADITTRVQPPLIIDTNAPLFAAPGDTFDAVTIVSNLMGCEETIAIDGKMSANLTTDAKTNTKLLVSDRADAPWTMPITVGNQLGNAEITVTASTDTVSRKNTATLSVRPATNYKTQIQAGVLDSETTSVRPPRADLYPEYASRQLYISAGADALMRPLIRFLDDYEYNCTEQMISRAIPYVLRRDNLNATTSDTMSNTLATLKNRQNDDGSFALWMGGQPAHTNRTNPNTANITAYTTLFLKLARDAGYAVPDDMMTRALGYLRTYAAQNITSASQARAAAYAIYVATMNGFVTTAYIDIFTQYADKNIKNWDSSLAGAYIAASYKLMHQDTIADKLFNKYKPAGGRFEYTAEFDNSVVNDAMYAYLAATHFGFTPEISKSVIDYIDGGNYSSYTSAVALLGLAGNSDTAEKNIPDITVFTDNTQVVTTVHGGTLVANIAPTAKRIVVKCPKCDRNSQLRYTLSQSGFPRNATQQSNGLSVIRHYYDADGNRTDIANLGDTLTVKIFVRARNGNPISNVVVSDLLPAGFVPNNESVSGDIDYFQPHEDRMLFYLTATDTDTIITYTVQVGISGKFTVPGIMAQSMYNPAICATAAQTKFTVSNAAKD